MAIRPDYLSISISSDEDSPYWQCEVSLRDARDYIKFSRDTPFLIHLLGVDYHFIVDARSLNRSIDDEGNYVETCTISGLSPLVQKAKPRATSITKTWETPIMASSAVEELLGSVTWDLVDWMIPAYRLAADNAAPLDIAQQVVTAAGGLIESLPDGGVLCRHRWPVSIAELDGAVPDKVLYETGIYSATESAVNDDLINRIRIGQDETFQDQMEYVPNKFDSGEDDPFNGVLYAFPSPWREGLRIVTTRPSVIQIGGLFEGVRLIEETSEEFPWETLTFSERESSTRYPIMTVNAFEWLDEDLGGLLVTPYSSRLQAGDGTYGGYSLGRISYSTRYLAVPVTCTEETEEIEAQFLLLETQNG